MYHSLVLRRELTWCAQLAIIAQGIAARYARRQASSEKAALYAGSFPYLGHAAEKVLVSEGIQLPSRSKL